MCSPLPRSFARHLIAVAFATAFAESSAVAQPPVPPAGDIAHGKALFTQTCGLCHATGQEKQPPPGQGPLLAGVFGRASASLPSFGYTPALQGAHLTWDAPTLDRFLTSPGTMVPGSAMVISVPDAKDRADLIAFLATLPAIKVAATAPVKHAPTAGDWQNDAPGKRHRIDLAQLPPPFATASAGNSPHTIARPAGAALVVPPGFQVKLFAEHLVGPRLLRTAPNGDIFLAETSHGQIRAIRTADGADAPTKITVFASNLDRPSGLAFYPPGDNPQWLYVGNLNSVVRFPYHNGDLEASGPPETIIPSLLETRTTGGHTSRDVAFSLDGKRMFICVGSGSNIADHISKKTPEEVKEWESSRARGAAWGAETNRANVLVTDPAGQNVHIYATGIRNPSGLTVHPITGDVWVATNERDDLGDDLVPDYISHIKEAGYYGWPWYYMGNHEDPRRRGERPDLAGEAILPDVPLQSHSAPLELAVYPLEISGPSAFPADYRGDIFACFHGSWNRTGRTGSKVVRVHLRDGVAEGDYEDFLTGFVIDDGHVWGRPVGVTVAHDGSLIISEDAHGTLWRISRIAP